MDTKELANKWKKVEEALNLTESSKELYGKVGWKPTSEPKDKNAKPEGGDPGVENAADKFDASKTPDTAPANKNKEGAEEAATEFKGSEKAAGGDSNDKKEGAAGGADIAKKGYAATTFRNKIRSAMGLSLDDKLNQPNAGKQGLSESKK
jgi:hypothetical protein